MNKYIPNNWELIQLGKIASVVSGGTPSRETTAFWGKDIPWVTPTDITKTQGRYLFNTAESLSSLGLSSSSATLLPPGTILMTSRATVGEARIAERAVCTNQGFKCLIPNKGIDSLFLFYQIQRCREAYKAFGIGSTFLEVSKKDTEHFELLLPKNIKEQQAISKILDCIDQTIEKTEALIHKYRQIKAGLMHDLFTRGLTADGKLRPSREQAPELYQETPIGWIPKEWELINASDICYPVTKGTTPSYFINSNGDDSIPYIRVENLSFDGSLDFENYSLYINKAVHNTDLNRSKVYAGDILMNIVGPPLGKVSLIPDDYKEWNVNQAVAIFRVKHKKHRRYLLYYLLSELAQKWFYVRSKRTSGQVNLTLEMCSNLEIPLPKNDSELLKISNFMAKILEIITIENKYLKKLITQKSGLMHDLLTGKVQVNTDPEKTAHASEG